MSAQKKGACNMWKTIIRRILVMIPQLFVLKSFNIYYGEIYAWGPFYRNNHSRNRSARIEELRIKAGFYDPWYVQYVTLDWECISRRFWK